MQRDKITIMGQKTSVRRPVTKMDLPKARINRLDIWYVDTS